MKDIIWQSCMGMWSSICDKSTIYEFTDIPFEELPKEVQTNVKQKKYVETEEELYAFLENYSS